MTQTWRSLIVACFRARRLSRPPALRDRKRLAAMIAPQVEVIVRSQENGEGGKVAIAADEILENGPTILGFRRLRGHHGPLGRAFTAARGGVYLRNIRPGRCGRKCSRRRQVGPSGHSTETLPGLLLTCTPVPPGRLEGGDRLRPQQSRLQHRRAESHKSVGVERNAPALATQE